MPHSDRRPASRPFCCRHLRRGIHAFPIRSRSPPRTREPSAYRSRRATAAESKISDNLDGLLAGGVPQQLLNEHSGLGDHLRVVLRALKEWLNECAIISVFGRIDFHSAIGAPIARLPPTESARASARPNCRSPNPCTRTAHRHAAESLADSCLEIHIRKRGPHDARCEKDQWDRRILLSFVERSNVKQA